MPNTPTDRITDFPQNDTLYWIRWVDGVSAPPTGRGTTASGPSIDVLLAEIPPDLQKFTDTSVAEAIVRADSSTVTCSVAVGLLPALALGTVYRRGVAIGRLRLPESTFRITANPSECPLHTVWERRQDSAPEWWTPDYPYRTVQRSSYPLGRALSQSYCVELPSNKGTILIPCSEVIRSLYAPCSVMVEALLSGPWETQQDNVISLKKSEGSVEGKMTHFFLRTLVKDDFAGYAANLCFDPIGFACAEEIYRHLAANALSSGPGVLYARPPIGKSSIRITGPVVRLQRDPDRYLMLQILRVPWWGEGSLHVYRDNPGDVGATQEPVDRPKPYSATAAVSFDDTVEVTSLEDPAAHSQVVTFRPPGIELINPPIIIRRQRKVSHTYNDPVVPGDARSTNTATPGQPTYGASSAARASYESHDYGGLPVRFRQIMAALETMQENGGIDSWHQTIPTEVGTARDGHFLWRIPTVVMPWKPGQKRRVPSRWQQLDSSRRDSPTRSALICRIHRKGRTIYLLDVEIRPKESGFQYLLFTLGTTPLRQAVEELLLACAESRGTWPNMEGLRERASLVSVRGHRRAYVKDNVVASDSAAVAMEDPRLLNTASLLRHLDRI